MECVCKSKWIRLTCLALALSGTTGFGLEVVKKGKPAAAIVVAIRVGTGHNAVQAAGGFMSRLFMYAPKGEE